MSPRSAARDLKTAGREPGMPEADARHESRPPGSRHFEFPAPCQPRGRARQPEHVAVRLEPFDEAPVALAHLHDPRPYQLAWGLDRHRAGRDEIRPADDAVSRHGAGDFDVGRAPPHVGRPRVHEVHEHREDHGSEREVDGPGAESIGCVHALDGIIPDPGPAGEVCGPTPRAPPVRAPVPRRANGLLLLMGRGNGPSREEGVALP